MNGFSLGYHGWWFFLCIHYFAQYNVKNMSKCVYISSFSFPCSEVLNTPAADVGELRNPRSKIVVKVQN